MPSEETQDAQDVGKMPSEEVQGAPDISSVRALVTDVGRLAEHLRLSYSGVYRWTKVNRIPGAHVIKVANFYDVEVMDLLPLTGSELSNVTRGVLKPKDTLPMLLEVYRGKRTLESACEELGIPLNSGKLVMTRWGDELPTLYTTLVQLDEGRISLETGMQRLNVAKFTLHNLRRKYGFGPRSNPEYRSEKEKMAEARGATRVASAEAVARQNEMTLRVIAGKITAYEAAERLRVGYRTIWRYVARLTDIRVHTLASWPLSLRAALAEEIAKKLPEYSGKWLKFAKKSRLMLRKSPRYPETPKGWGGVPLKRLLVAVLLGEATLDEIAEAREVDRTLLAALFTGDLRAMDLTFDEVMDLPLAHQVALAELLLAALDRMRKVDGGEPEDVEVSQELTEEERKLEEALAQEREAKRLARLEAAKVKRLARLEGVRKELEAEIENLKGVENV